MGKSSEDVLRFEPSAYLQRLLGRELLTNEYSAIAELVKNAYDAGAKEVTIELIKNVPQQIIISDNGRGMSFEEFERLWMSPGYSEKPEEALISGRPILGEKGIGRFAADKIAKTLSVITKKAGEKDALKVDFDWDEFEDRRKKMYDIEIPYSRVDDIYFGKYQSGTILELENLRKEWTGHDWARLRTELQRLITPYRKIKGFKIIARAEDWKSGEVESLFDAKAEYSYEFSLSKGGYRTRKLNRTKHIAEKLNKNTLDRKRVMYGETSFGPIKGHFFYVEKHRSLKKEGFDPGVVIYRDGFLVEPYGISDNDWLGVKSKKASRHGHAPITPTKLYGFVEITVADNPRLRDVSSRQGLLNNTEFSKFRKFVTEEFTNFSTIIGEDKELLETLSESIAAQRAGMMRHTRAEAFGDMAIQLAHQLRQPLSTIRVSVTNISDRLKKKKLSDIFIDEASELIDRNIHRMDENIKNLSRLARGLKDEVVDIDLTEFIFKLRSIHEPECNQHGISIRVSDYEAPSKVKFSRASLNFIADNLISNAINTAKDIKESQGLVIIGVEETQYGKIRLTVTDNGNRVPDEHREILFEEIIQSSSGFGQGLYWSHRHAEQHGARIGFEDIEPIGTKFFVEFECEEK
jgi:signal transduction histidine kinase